MDGPVEQPGVLATLSRSRSGVQIPSGPRSEAAETARSPGEVAQLAEHAAENRGVGGSIPSLATKDALVPRRGMAKGASAV
jgi:hypothetical protein